MHTYLIENIKKLIPLDSNVEETIFRYFVPITLRNKEFLLQEGQVCKSYYFVSKGCLRLFFNNEKGAEQITQFALEGWWLADYFSFLDQKPSENNIQAIEKAEVLAIDFQSYNKLLDEAPVLEKYFRVVAQRGMAASQVRLKLDMSLSKEEMYRHFSSSFPDFVQRVPQYMLASFLGLTPEYLSEIRKKNIP